MAKTKKKTIVEKTKYTCRDCVNSYDWNGTSLKGNLICCRCKFDKGSEFGKWCKFLSDPQCEHFKLR